MKPPFRSTRGEGFCFILCYAAIKGIYEKGKLTFLEPAPTIEKSEVIVTFITPDSSQPAKKRIPGVLKRLGEVEGKTYSIPDDFNDLKY
ncbi:MAG: hypothetical protein ACI9V1_000180 [Spirosomataceae bacterium]